MARAPLAVGVLVTVASLTLTGCAAKTSPGSRQGLVELTTGVQQARTLTLPESDLARLLRQSRGLGEVPSSRFTPEDLEVRTTLQTQSDEAAMAFMDRWASDWARSAYTSARDAADVTARDALRQEVRAEFVEDLQQITLEAIKGQACDLLLDAGFPEPEQSGDEDGWQGDLERTAADRLAVTWTAAGIAESVNWMNWSIGVGKAAVLIVEAVREHPEPYLELVARPPVQRAAVAYATFCHGPPRTTS